MSAATYRWVELVILRPHAKRAQMGGMLSAYELMEIANTIRASRILRQFIEAIVADEDIEIPHFMAKKDVIPDSYWTWNMKSMLASMTMDMLSTVHQVRYVPFDKDLRMQEGRVREKLESYTRGRNAAKMLSDSIVTIRNDRFVIPVKAEYRSHFGGVIHDMSSSGQTLFIEPDAVVQANNEITTFENERARRNRKNSYLNCLLKVQEIAHDLFILSRYFG